VWLSIENSTMSREQDHLVTGGTAFRFHAKMVSPLPAYILAGLLAESPLVVEEASFEIGNATIGSNHVCKAFHEVRGHDLMMLVLLKWPCHEAIQAQCYRALASVAECTPAFRNALRSKKRWLEITVGSLVRFQSSAQVQLFGSSLISNLVVVSREGQDKPHKQKEHFVNELQGIDLIVAAITTFPDYAQIQATSCRILCRLISEPSCELASLLVSSGAVVAVEHTLRKAAAGSEVHKIASAFMKGFRDRRVATIQALQN
jgi:hypothetical protein